MFWGIELYNTAQRKGKIPWNEVCDHLQCRKLFSYGHYFTAKVRTLSEGYSCCLERKLGFSFQATLLKFTRMKTQLSALEVTELPPNQASSSHEGFSPRQPLQPPAAHSLHTEGSSAAGKPTELMDTRGPGSREGNEILPWCCFKAARCHRQVTGVGPVKAGETRNMLLPECFNQPSNSKPETKTQAGLQTGTSTAQLRAKGRKLKRWEEVLDSQAPSQPWHGVHRVQEPWQAGLPAQKEGGGGNFEIPLFKYIVNCRAQTKDFCKK